MTLNDLFSQIKGYWIRRIRGEQETGKKPLRKI